MHLALIPFYVHSLLVLLFLAVSVLMILVILIQKPQGGGLSGAFGAGASSGQTAFGAKTGDMLTWLTVGMFCLFLMFAIVLNFTTRQNPFATAPPTTIQGVSGNEGPGEGAAVPDSIPAEQPTDQPTETTEQPDEQGADQQAPEGDQPAAPSQPGETPTQGEPEPKTEPGGADPPKTNEGEPDPPPPAGDPRGGPAPRS